ncbi:hypothetical protein HG536_0E01930 [Torulaspora globosa]|uniref:Uncharacterized protein n=1 Tax=Torulaspora globosa TaxID=48254 RepID=A0A7G3ZIE6_9SACH|nr:uncharacterized protein HG536_0E01930 [Torulaspora globosa]QLL33282.1 hypothetical protein HG536_0E01930 [Torulaspora globosa]
MIVPDMSERDRGCSRTHREKGLSRTLRKWMVAVRKFTHEALNNIDDRDRGEDRINGLFHGELAPLKSVASVDRESGTSVTPVGASEMRLTTETEESLAENSTQANGGAGEGTDDRSPQDDELDHETDSFERFDTYAEYVKLRNESREPFCRGPELWERRRALWLRPAASQAEETAQQSRRELFATIPQAYHTRIFKKLVMDNKPLREPMNLQDAIQIINAGWIETRKWENAAKGLA